MNDTRIIAERLEMISKFRTIVRLNVRERYRSHLFECPHEVCGVGRGVGSVRIGESELTFEVNGCQDISPNAIGETDNRVGFDQRSFVALATQFWLGLSRFPFHKLPGLPIKRDPDGIR